MPKYAPNNLKERVLSDIADSIIALVTDDSSKGLEKIIKAVDGAAKEYKGDNYSWITKSVLTYSRQRQDVANNTKNELDNKDIILRLQALIKVFLDPQGAWKSTSYNTTLLVQLMGAVDEDSNPSNNKFYYDIVYDLAKPFKQKLQATLQEYIFTQKISQAKEKELNHLSNKAQQELIKKSVLTSDAKTAMNFVKDSSDKIPFHLHKIKAQWHVDWYDNYGGVNELATSNKLSEEINKIEKQFGSKDMLKQASLKKVCVQARKAYLEQRRVLINPQSSELNELSSTFVLKGSKGNYELSWYDYQGIGKKIDLSKQLKLDKFLKTVSTWNDKTKFQVTLLLRRINNMNPLSINKAKQALESFFKKKDEDQSFTFELLIDPNKESYNKLKSTFVLLNKSNRPQLKWFDILGKSRNIDISKYKDIKVFLKNHKTLSNDESYELKKLLLEVDTSKNLGREDFKNKLAACLEKKLHSDNSNDTPLKPAKKLEDTLDFDVNKFKQRLQSCLGDKESDQVKEKKEPKPPSKKLDLSKFKSVANFFGEKVQTKSTEQLLEKKPENSPQLGLK